MMLNLLRLEDLSVEDMIRRSFSEFHTQRALGAQDLPKMLRKEKENLATADRRCAAEACAACGAAAHDVYYGLSVESGALSASLHRHIVLRTKHATTTLCPGRLIELTSDGLINALAVVCVGAKFDPAHGAGGTLTAFALCPEGFLAPDAPRDGAAFVPVGDRVYALLAVGVESVHVTATARRTVDAAGLLARPPRAAAVDAAAIALLGLELSGTRLEQMHLARDLKIFDMEYARAANDLHECVVLPGAGAAAAGGAAAAAGLLRLATTPSTTPTPTK